METIYYGTMLLSHDIASLNVQQTYMTIHTV